MNVPVVFVNRYFYPDESATSQFTSDLAFELARRGHPVIAVTSRQAYEDPKREFPPQEKVGGVSIHRILTSRRGRTSVGGLALDYLTFYLSSAWRLWRTLRPGWIVVARTDPPVISVVVWLVARLRAAKLVNWLADLFPEVASELDLPGGAGLLGKALRRARNVSLKGASANVVLGDAVAEHLLKEGISGHRIRVIRDWADGSRIRPVDKDRNPLAREWGMADAFVIGYSGNMGRVHEFQTVVEAMDRLRHRRDLRFLFIGGGIRQPEVASAVQARQLANVVFKPFQPFERLAETLTVPDIHLVTLRPGMEGLIVPSKFYGVAAAGRPTLYVGHPDGEIPRLISKHRCGLTVPTGDVDGLVKAIEDLSSDPVLYGSLATNARAAFERHFERAVPVSAWCDLLEEVGSVASKPTRGRSW